MAEEVLKLMERGGADVSTPFTFPTGVLSLGPGSSPSLANLDLALALQSGYSLPLLLSSAGGLGGGGPGPLPLPAALALPSLELPKLLSLEGLGTDAVGNLGPSGKPSAEDGSEPSNSGMLQLSRGQPVTFAPPARQPSQISLPPKKRDRDFLDTGAVAWNKRQTPERPAAETLLAVAQQEAQRQAEREQELERARQRERELREAAQRAAREEELRRAAEEEEEARQFAQQETDSDSETTGGKRRGPAKGRRGGKAGSGLPKDPAARAQARQLKKRDLNREAQRRFRDRQKAALSLLESTTQGQQREIDALRLTNKLLEEQYQVLMEQYRALQLRFLALQTNGDLKRE